MNIARKLQVIAIVLIAGFLALQTPHVSADSSGACTADEIQQGACAATSSQPVLQPVPGSQGNQSSVANIGVTGSQGNQSGVTYIAVVGGQGIQSAGAYVGVMNNQGNQSVVTGSASGSYCTGPNGALQWVNVGAPIPDGYTCP